MDVIHWLWERRGALRCYLCNASSGVITAPMMDSLGVKSIFFCLHCNDRLNSHSLAEHNGFVDK